MKVIIIVIMLLCPVLMSAQSYNVGTSTTTKDVFGHDVTKQSSDNPNTSIWTW